jgi:hypothetical protein
MKKEVSRMSTNFNFLWILVGSISSEDYLNECLSLAPREALPTFFPELICLLPDIKKQEVNNVFVMLLKLLYYPKMCINFPIILYAICVGIDDPLSTGI